VTTGGLDDGVRLRGERHSHPDPAGEQLDQHAVGERDGQRGERPGAAREARRAFELTEQGHILRVWLLPDGRTLGLYQAREAGELEAMVASLPLIDWMTVETVPLTPHPNDPARAATEGDAVRQSG
jgi:muconolactone delta-isomerase